MKKILFIERKPSTGAVSIEKVFRQIAKNLSKENYSSSFQSLTFENNLVGTIKNLLSFKKRKADIYHITGHVHYIALVLPKKNTVLTIHDVGILHIRSGLRRYILKKLLFDLPIRKLKFITAVSETTKNDILLYCKCPPDKIRVIENPLQEHFFVNNKKPFDAACPVILQIGTTANKNIPNLIEALEGIECRLSIIGKIDDKIIDSLNSKKITFENKVNLNNTEIKEAYENADIVSFCSTFEGFGLPIIEAQAMLTPVVTSNLSPMKEVAGFGAALVDPKDPESIRTEIMRIINDSKYRNELVKRGIENVERFKPLEISAMYEQLYEEMLSFKQIP